jgi:hypothetical protein
MGDDLSTVCGNYSTMFKRRMYSILCTGMNLGVYLDHIFLSYESHLIDIIDNVGVEARENRGCNRFSCRKVKDEGRLAHSDYPEIHFLQAELSCHLYASTIFKPIYETITTYEAIKRLGRSASHRKKNE